MGCKQAAREANMMAALVFVINFNDIPTIFAQVDVIIAATTAQLPLLGKVVETVVSNHPEKAFLDAGFTVPVILKQKLVSLSSGFAQFVRCSGTGER